LGSPKAFPPSFGAFGLVGGPVLGANDHDLSLRINFNAPDREASFDGAADGSGDIRLGEPRCRSAHAPLFRNRTPG